MSIPARVPAARVEILFGQPALCPSVYLLSGVKRRSNAAQPLRSLSPAIGFAQTKAAPVKEEAARGSTYIMRRNCFRVYETTFRSNLAAFNPVQPGGDQSWTPWQSWG
jgi:hypothetical protein